MSWSTNTPCRTNRRAPRLADLAVAGSLVIVSAGLASASHAAAQGLGAALPTCAEGVVGHLGITGLDCRGCSVTFKKGPEGWQRVWSFGTEPRITEIAPGSPAAGALQVGDEIVGIGGWLITSAEGGRRFASLEPDQTVTIRYRRGGQTADAALRAATRCGQFVEGMKTDPTTWSVTRGSLEPGGGLRIQMDDPDQKSVTIDRLDASRPGDPVTRLPIGDLDIKLQPGDPTTGRREVTMGAGRLGFRWSCQGSCSGTRRADGLRVWRFSGPVRVSGIEMNGPADIAGIRIGDLLTAVNGHRIESRKGGEMFSEVQSGQEMRFTLRGSDGRERTVTVVPVTRTPDEEP